ncbi:MAG: helix-turn-helix domain-containing protein [Clostridia bacterium]|nr:helix-turn-helix domain-containing protein [Clostridia bacterium]
MAIATYIEKHREREVYTERSDHAIGTAWKNREGWWDHQLGEHFIFSHRTTAYTRETFTDTLHMHPYYELVIYLRGDVRYIVGDRMVTPAPGDILLCRPGALHTANLLRASVYDRVVLYFPAVSALPGWDSALLPAAEEGFCFTLRESERRNELLSMVGELESALTRDRTETPTVCYSLLLRLLLLLHREMIPADAAEHLPEAIRQIKEYIDENYTTLGGVEEIAAHFFYSREYLSRLFRRTLNTTVSDYLLDKKLTHSKKLLETGASVTDACFSSGFHNMSSFIRNFRDYAGVLPSVYRKRFHE